MLLTAMCGCTLMLLCAPAVVLAQEDAQPGDRAAEPVRTPAKQSLEFRGLMFGDYTGDFWHAQTAVAPAQVGKDGQTVASSRVRGTYKVESTSIRLNSTGSAAFESVAGGDQTARAYTTNSMLSGDLGDKTTVSLGAQANRSPYYEFAQFLPEGIFAADLVPVGSREMGVVLRDTRTLAGSAGVSRRIAKRTDLTFDSDIQNVAIGDGGSNDFQAWNVKIGLRRHLTKRLAFNVGYGRGAASYTTPSAEPFRIDTAEIGVSHTGLRLGRRSALTFATGMSGVQTSRDRQYSLNANAMLSHEFGRSWTGSAGYVRGMQFVPGFLEPFWTDSVTAGMSGWLQRRVQMTVSASYSRGNVGFTGRQPFDLHSVGGRLIVLLTNNLAAFTQYGYYGYRAPAALSALPLVGRIDRQHASVGLQLWVPVMGERERRPERDSR